MTKEIPGIGQMESDLVDVVRRNMKQNESLRVNILLDYTRGTRGKKNSKAMLMPLLQSSNCNLSLYHTPQLRGIKKKFMPARWNELLGLQHMKLYLFDDTVLISGANLSNDYFANRQDRYMEIEDKKLADFFAGLIEKVQEFSMRVDSSGEVNLHKDWKLLPYEGDRAKFAEEAKKRLRSFFEETFAAQRTSKDEGDTWIFPTMEMGQLNVHHDSVVMRRILMNAEPGSKLNMATGYFNLTQSLMDTVVKNCEADCSFIMAHPNANGFKGAKGPAGGIPDAYTLLARKFLEQIKLHGKADRISLLEYERPQWTYHAKGLWYTPSGSSLPCMTVVGSSNYGERSVNRDLESQICLVTSNESLQRALKAEYDHLKQFAATAEGQLVSRFVPKWVRTVVFLFKNFF
jgi:CDP-diacylglycerol---glycerol-3-phosphate 3-phosphatidyltransferase